MNNYPEHSLTGISNTLIKHRLFIFTFFISAVIAGVILRLIIPEKYEAEAVFILKNPLYGDRSNLYNNDTKQIDYFANEDEIDKLITLAESDPVQNKIIRDLRLDSVYDYDTTKLKDLYKLKKRFNKRLKIYRTENKNVVLAFTDTDPKRAAAVANLYVEVVEKAMRALYTDMKDDNYQTLTNKIQEEDRAIMTLTDSLVHLREQYEIYDIISPLRSNIMLGAMKANGHAGYSRGIEQVQNIESVKDELVSERARHIALANQYTKETGYKQMILTQIVKKAKIQFKPQEPDMLTTIIGSGLLGLLFGTLYVLRRNFQPETNS